MTTLYKPADVLWQRALTRVRADKQTGCWVYDGCLTSKGYGCTSAGRKSKNVLVHRLAVIVRDGFIPTGLVVDHTCENKRCCRSAHLEVVTVAENNRRIHQRAMQAQIAQWATQVRRWAIFNGIDVPELGLTQQMTDAYEAAHRRVLADSG